MSRLSRIPRRENMNTIEIDDGLRQKLSNSLPPIFTRQTAAKLLGGLISTGTLANLDCDGKGPPVKIRLGRKVAYERDTFIDWFFGRLEPTKARNEATR